ncbi:hypothetical protein SAMN05443252_107148 [Bacillus sp. OV322]|uniref:hypothetical protein n=1 Tax=Bacillus sp. OV322 TaxID=1882764 RepID=UPI0008E6693A|nr:hypothetical protein [Bacillus sp. OV322]SFC86979.1 hypothetical protein SAMN05443252_107148 [Bacillus sp. OV322]
MKRFMSLLLVFIVLLGIGIYYYVNLDKNYHLEKGYYNFPIPDDAKLESENKKAKNYEWDPATGTEVPLGYRLMIKKSGWKQIDIEGANMIYQKNGNIINLNFDTDYIEITKESR